MDPSSLLATATNITGGNGTAFPMVLPFAWDPHYYFTSFLATVVIQLTCFFIAYACQFDKITDFAGSVNFVILAVLTLCCGGQYHPRQIAVTVMLCVSRIELAIFLLWRVIKRGRDARFDEVRTKFFPFLLFWIFQILWVYGVSISVVFVNTAFNVAPLGVLDYVGIGMFTLGFGVQVVADFQKYGFRANPANKGKLCDIGVWGISRHPNYFGEFMIWWGIFVTSVLSFGGLSEGWVCIISPLWTMVILLFLTGMPTAEGAGLERFYRSDESRAYYENYRKRTSVIIPFIPAVYNVLPYALKAVFCFEFPLYQYKPTEKKEDDLESNLKEDDADSNLKV